VKKLKFVVERHRDGYVAYPLGLKGAVVGQGESYESVLANAKSAAAFHIESFGKEAFDDQDDVMEAFVTEASLTTGYWPRNFFKKIRITDRTFRRPDQGSLPPV
jgi:predicted RNase H-like HicB family nuclease